MTPLLVTLAYAAAAVAALVYAAKLWRARGAAGMRDTGLLWFPLNVSRAKEATREAVQAFGAVHLTWMGLEPMVTVADADTAQQLLNDTEVVLKDFLITDDALAAPLSKDSINNVNGERWKRQRAVVSPALLHDTLRRFYAGPFVDCTRKAIGVLEALRRRSGDGVVDAVPVVRAFAMDVLGLAGFGQCFSSLDAVEGTKETTAADARLVEAYETYVREMVNVARISAPALDKYNLLPSSRPLRAAVEVLRGHVSGLLEHARRRARDGGGAAGAPSTFAGCLVAEAAEQAMTEGERVANAFLVYLAGQDTTQMAISWTLALLASHPEAQRRARAQVDEVLADGRLPSFDDLRDLPYLLWVVQESMRLEAPSVILPTRRAARNVRCPNGVTVPAGALVSIAVDAMHHDPKHWPDPERFDPERFSPEGRKGRHAYAYLPFSLGRRVCAGRNFSLAEQQLFLAALLQRYELHEVVPTAEVRCENTIFFFNNPAEVRVRLVPRDE